MGFNQGCKRVDWGAGILRMRGQRVYWGIRVRNFGSFRVKLGQEFEISGMYCGQKEFSSDRV